MRWAYPRGVHALLHRWGTRAADAAPPARVAALDRPAALTEALTGLSSDRGARPLGGGTDLLPLIEQGLARPTRLVDLGSVTALADVSQSAAGDLSIGAGVTLAALARRPEVAGDHALRRAIAAIASPQIREMATVGGNLCQAKRCWFYRNGFDCYKRRGVTAPCYAVLGDNRYYHAVLGAHRCQAVTPSDLATVLGALDATVRLASRGGERTLPVARLYTGPGETALRPGEIVARRDGAGRRARPGERLREAAPLGGRLLGRLRVRVPGRRGRPRARRADRARSGRADAVSRPGRGAAPARAAAGSLHHRRRRGGVDAGGPPACRETRGRWTPPADSCGAASKPAEPSMAPDADPDGPACARAVHAALRTGGVNFAVSLPDSVLHPVDRLLDADPDVQTFVCSREDEGVAMAVGAYLGGKVPVALMEGSGLGYCALVLARAQIQRTPLLLLVSHNGALGEAFDFHGASRAAAEGVLRGLNIPHVVLTDRAQAPRLVQQALVTVLGQKTAVGLLVPPYLFAGA